jgi:hypothetical protein
MRVVSCLFTAHFREGFFNHRSKNGTQPIQTVIAALLRGQIRESLRKVLFHVLVNLADGRPLFD